MSTEITVVLVVIIVCATIIIYSKLNPSKKVLKKTINLRSSIKDKEIQNFDNCILNIYTDGSIELQYWDNSGDVY